MRDKTQAFFASAPMGTESALATELEELGAQRVAAMPRGVAFEGDMRVGYRSLLHSRIASRVLMRLAQGPVSGIEDLDALVDGVDWSQHLRPQGRFAVMARTAGKAVVTDARYLALRVKDHIADQFRARHGQRPDVDRDDPDLTVHVHLGQRRAQVSIDWSGQALFRRGYRQGTGVAPIKEHLAAAVLRRADWPAIYGASQLLLDPCCGSGTFLCEAFAIATGRPAALDRRELALFRWLGFDEAIWRSEFEEGKRSYESKLAQAPAGPWLWGADEDPRMLDLAQHSLERLGAGPYVKLVRARIADMEPVAPAGLVVANPPWGQRMGDLHAAGKIYEDMGQRLRDAFEGWRFAILAGDPSLGSKLGIYAPKRVKLENAKVPMQLLLGQVQPRFFVQARKDKQAAKRLPSQDLANRLKKKKAQLQAWVKRENIKAYRLYDAELPEYAVAIDVYDQDYVVQEYQAPRDIPEQKARERLGIALATLQETFKVPSEHLFIKRRARQRGLSQYEKVKEQRQEREVQEGPAKLIVNLSDYLDTGLFLDHRMVRAEVGRLSQGKRLLNLFCYTASATVVAALAGASSSLSVDMSTTYLDWAHRNFVLNDLDLGKHKLVRADCLEFLRKDRGGYDVIFCDPPTFSNSKRMAQSFDVQRDHRALIEDCMKLLAPGGVLVFSCNARTFRLDEGVKARWEVSDWQKRTTPPDFAKRMRWRHCFMLRERLN